MTNEQALIITTKFPHGPKTKREQAELHQMMYEMENSLIHLHGSGFVSVIYPGYGVEVFETDDVGEWFASE